MTAPHPVIGLIGKKRSGKDSFASTLVSERGFMPIAFADSLKQSVLQVDPWVDVTVPPAPAIMRFSDVIETYGWEVAKDKFPEVRRLLQEYGVSVREIEPDFWIDAALAKAETPGRYVITDVRFPNEVDAVRQDLGGIIVRIHRPGLVSDDTHASETALDDYEADYTIDNSGTLEDLAAQARMLPL